MRREFSQGLRRGGAVGNAASTLLTLLTSNWGLAASVFIGVVAAVWEAANRLAENPHVQIGVAVFLGSLWTIIGVLQLIDRAKPRLVTSFQDYRYGLVFEGFASNFIPTNMPLPDSGSLGFGVHIRNYSSGPIKYVLESMDIRIGTRITPRYVANSVSGYMARGSARLARGEPFPPGSLAEFYGKGTIKGTADFSIAYGPPEGTPVRRLKVNLELFVAFPEAGAIDQQKGAIFVYSDSILSETDEAI